ncbi:two pore domain potassium channel family protein [bacterium]|nr:two pore domain potassium channel family protein [bacterium]
MSDTQPRSGPRAAHRRFFLFALAGRSRALVLLLALVGQIVLTAVDVGHHMLPSLYHAIVIIAAMVMAADERGHLRTGWLIGGAAIALSVAADLVDTDPVAWVSYLVTVSFYVFVIRLMLGRIFRARDITLDVIGYALCTYVLLGTLWTLLYAPFAVLDPHAFSQPLGGGGRAPGADLIYFSFVTLTTLGYGDISPVAPVVRALAILEALTGTLFLAVLISRLVGGYKSSRNG